MTPIINPDVLVMRILNVANNTRIAIPGTLGLGTTAYLAIREVVEVQDPSTPGRLMLQVYQGSGGQWGASLYFATRLQEYLKDSGFKVALMMCD